MARQHTKASRRLLLTWFLLASGILLLIPDTLTSKLQFAFLDLLRLPIRSGRRVALLAQTTASAGGVVAQDTYRAAIEQNLQLQNHIHNLEAALAQQQQQIDQLTGFRQVKSWERMRFLPAEAYARIDPQLLLLNRGTAEGLSKGQLVLADNAVIGTIAEVGTHTAKVELVTSPGCRLPVTAWPSNVQGVLRGQGDGFMEIQVKRPCATAVGEKVYVQKMPG